MAKIDEFKGKAKRELEELKRAAKARTLGYITAGFGFVAGLAWNQAIIALIDELITSSRDTIFAKFLYAAVLTVMVVVVSMYVERLLRSWDDKKQ